MTFRQPVLFRTKGGDLIKTYDPQIEGSYEEARTAIVEAAEQGLISDFRRDAYLSVLETASSKRGMNLDQITEADETIQRIYSDEEGARRLMEAIKNKKTG